MEKLVSICIPCSEMKGNGVRFLKELLTSIEKQTYKNLEIVVSDHSKNNNIEIFCGHYDKFKIKYLRDINGRGNISNNLNNAMDNANGDYIKLIAQDDLFYDNNAISIMIEKKLDFVAGGCKHFKDKNDILYNYHIPNWTDDILWGVNRIGGVSVVLFKKTDIRFDSNLVGLVDCDFYYKLSNQYGLPFCIPEHFFNIRLWDGSISDSINWGTVLEEERKYIKNKIDLK